MKKIFYLIIVFVSITSCATKDEIVYFQNIDQIKNFDALEQFQPVIEVNDQLRIQVSSINDELVEIYNLNMGNSSGGGGNNDNTMQGYLVDAKGNITFPVLGDIKVINKTTNELEEYLTGILRVQVKDATVRVRLTNFKVTVMGEVGGRGVIEIPNERVTIPEVIAMAGGISYNGQRENILVIRNYEGKLTYGRVDLTDASVFKDPFYYLKQNDIVYVEPTYRQVKSAGFITNWQGLVSIITTAFSLYFLFTLKK